MSSSFTYLGLNHQNESSKDRCLFLNAVNMPLLCRVREAIAWLQKELDKLFSGAAFVSPTGAARENSFSLTWASALHAVLAAV